MADARTVQAATNQLETWMEEIDANHLALEAAGESPAIARARFDILQHEYQLLKMLLDRLKAAPEGSDEQLRVALEILDFPGITLIPVRCKAAVQVSTN